MKIRIIAKDGELRERLPDVIRAVQRLAGEALEKAVKEEEKPKELELPILDAYVDQSSEVAERVRKRMLERILKVVG